MKMIRIKIALITVALAFAAGLSVLHPAGATVAAFSLPPQCGPGMHQYEVGGTDACITDECEPVRLGFGAFEYNGIRCPRTEIGKPVYEIRITNDVAGFSPPCDNPDPESPMEIDRSLVCYPPGCVAVYLDKHRPPGIEIVCNMPEGTEPSGSWIIGISAN